MCNEKNIPVFVGGDPENKVSLLLDYTLNPGDVADPWYSGDFKKTWDDIKKGANAFINSFAESLKFVELRQKTDLRLSELIFRLLKIGLFL